MAFIQIRMNSWQRNSLTETLASSSRMTAIADDSPEAIDSRILT